MEIQIVNTLTNAGTVTYVSDNCSAEYGVGSWGLDSHLNGTAGNFGARCFDWKSASSVDG